MPMSRSGNIAATAVLGVLVCLLAVPARAQLSAVNQPNPPPQICVNGQCATTPTPPPAPSPVVTSGKIKWNPGHYMASNTVVYGGRSPTFMYPEMDDLNNQDAIVGYRMFITWGAMEPTPGNYDFSAIDAALARLKTYNKPKRLVIMLWLYGQHALGQNDGTVFPTYIRQDPTYGASPVAGSYGWWGQHANGASTGMYAPALYYRPVMDRLIAMVQAMGQHLDGDPNVEGFFVQEDSTIAQAALFPSPDPHYSDNAWLTQLQRLLTAATAAFPHTNVILANSYFQQQDASVAMEQWMASNRIAAGAADSLGQSAISTYGTGLIGWGLQAYIGDAQFGGVDLRPKMTVMMDVEQPDVNGNYFAGYGGPYTPLDIINAMNQTYYASHAFWTRLTGSGVSAAVQWPALAATCAAHPLTHTAYPANYP